MTPDEKRARRLQKVATFYKWLAIVSALLVVLFIALPIYRMQNPPVNEDKVVEDGLYLLLNAAMCLYFTWQVRKLRKATP